MLRFMMASNMSAMFALTPTLTSETLKPMNGHIEWEQQVIDISVTFAVKDSPGILPGRDINSLRRNVLHRQFTPVLSILNCLDHP